MDLSRIYELLDCPLCLEPLHQSKVLQCQHTFCKRCLRRSMSTMGDLQCSECKSVYSNIRIEDLPPNILLERLRHELNRLNEPEQPVLWKWQGIKGHQIQPMAIAISDFPGTGEGEVPFCKGDTILLTCYIDEGWYEGVVKGKKGMVSTKYMEITVPFPNIEVMSNQEPCALALNDFNDGETKYMLNFKKGDVIKVIKKINENWCVGMMDNHHGVFPLNYVELNAAADILLYVHNSDGSDEADDLTEQRFDTESDQDTEQAERRHTIEIDSRDALSSAHLEQRINSSSSNSHRRDRRVSESSIQETVSKYANMKASSSSDDVLDDINRMETWNFETSHGTTIESQSNGRINPPASYVHLYKCFREYVPRNLDELALQFGEIYCVEGKARVGWFQGYHMRSKQSGIFPCNCVHPKRQKPTTLHRSMSANPASQQSCQDPVPAQQGVSGRPVSTNRQTSAGHPVNRSTSLRMSVPTHMHSASAPALMTNIPVRCNNGSPVRRTVPMQRRVRTGSEPADPSSLTQRETPKTRLSKLFRSLKKKRAADPAPSLPPYREAATNPTSAVHNRRIPILPGEPPPPYSPPHVPPPRLPIEDMHTYQNQQAGGRCRAMTSFPAQNENEIELNAGDVLIIVRKLNDGWYYGKSQRTGKVGFFPSSFVERF